MMLSALTHLRVQRALLMMLWKAVLMCMVSDTSGGHIGVHGV